MKYTFDFSSMPAYVLIKTGEFAVVEDFYQLLKNLTDSPKWIKGRPQIVDHQNLDLSKTTPEDMKMIRSIVEFYSDKLGNGKCAFVVTDNIGLLSAEYYGQSAKVLHSEIRVFTSIAAAKEWVLS